MDVARRTRHHRAEHELPLDLSAASDFETAFAERDAVTRAFETLSADHRAAFVLRHHLGHSVAEVADALQVRLGTAKSRLHYAEKAMAAALDADARWTPEGGVA